MKHIFIYGPEARTDRDGDEHPEWTVYVGDDHAEPVSTVYRIHTLKKARALAAIMRRDRLLPVIDEAVEA